jgi:lysozyme
LDVLSKARAMLIFDEGLRLKAYQCSEGFWTLGVGRNLSARGVTASQLLWYRTMGITRAKAIQWLDEDISKARDDCHRIFGSSEFGAWSENRRLGWINLAFNLGRSRLLGFYSTIPAARRGDWAKVEAGLRGSRWAQQVGSRSERVIRMICREEFPGVYAQS